MMPPDGKLILFRFLSFLPILMPTMTLPHKKMKVVIKVFKNRHLSKHIHTHDTLGSRVHACHPVVCSRTDKMCTGVGLANSWFHERPSMAPLYVYYASLISWYFVQSACSGGCGHFKLISLLTLLLVCNNAPNFCGRNICDLRGGYRKSACLTSMKCPDGCAIIPQRLRWHRHARHTPTGMMAMSDAKQKLDVC